LLVTPNMIKIACSLLAGMMLYLSPVSASAGNKYIDNTNNPLKIESRIDNHIGKYAVIFSPGSFKDKELVDYSFDGGTKNSFLITIANIYHSLKKMGYQDKNIRILYHDGRIDASETLDPDKIKALAEDKFSKPADAATSKNLESTLDELSQKIDENDEFTFVVMNHGFREGPTAYINDFNDDSKQAKIYPSDIELWTSRIKAKNQLFVVDSCYSGQFGVELGKGNRVVLTSSAQYSPSVVSRIDQFSRFFFNAAADLDSDLDGDGKVTVGEAFKVAEEQRLPILEKHKEAGDLAFYKLEGFYAKKFNLDGNNFIMYQKGDFD
jgi:hypothetical protein